MWPHGEGQSTGFRMQLINPNRQHKELPETKNNFYGGIIMGFFNSAVGVLQTLVIALGAGLGIWGVVNLMEGYGNDNPGAKSQSMKHIMPNKL